MGVSAGQAHPHYGRLAQVSVRALRRGYLEEKLTTRELGKRYGVSKTAIRNVLVAAGIERRKGGNKGQCGPANPNWKGAAVGYGGAHDRVRKLRGIPKHCEECGTTNPNTRYEWSNNTGRYDDPNDYTRRCISCHRRRDARKKDSRHPGGTGGKSVAQESRDV